MFNSENFEKEVTVKANNTKYILSLSYGKDSVATLLYIIENKLPLDRIVHCKIMFDKDLSGEHPLMAKWIPIAEQIINQLLKENGYNCQVDNITAIRPFVDEVFRKRVRGKREGERLGFPNPICAWCNSALKLKPLKDYINGVIKQGFAVKEYIGIAKDEPKRLERYNKISTENHKYITLADFNMTEVDAMQLCKTYNLLSPMYKGQFRGGCWFCPKQAISSLYKKWVEYPELYNKLIDIEKLLRAEDNHQSAFTYSNVHISDIIKRFENGYKPKERKRSKDKQISMFD